MILEVTPLIQEAASPHSCVVWHFTLCCN